MADRRAGGVYAGPHRLHCVHLFQFHEDRIRFQRFQRPGAAAAAGGAAPSGPRRALAQRLTMHIVRKMAHFCEYTLEGFLLMLCMRVYTRRYVRHISVPMLGGVLTAMADETIQIYSPGRSSQVTDVWLDSAGVLAGILIALVFMALCRMLFHRCNKE